jgi:hypothetical protein
MGSHIFWFSTFHSHLIAQQNFIWFNDGMETGADVEYEGTITSVDLESSRSKKVAKRQS